jgi:hypothetical protein
MYDNQLDADFHQAAVAEMLRVGREVRLFPLQNTEGAPSPFVAPLVENLRRRDFAVSLERVPYEFQQGGSTMLRIARRVSGPSILA